VVSGRLGKRGNSKEGEKHFCSNHQATRSVASGLQLLLIGDPQTFKNGLVSQSE
jgi:hypothetical protein